MNREALLWVPQRAVRLRGQGRHGRSFLYLEWSGAREL